MVKKVMRKVARGTTQDPDAQLLARAHAMDAALFGRQRRPGVGALGGQPEHALGLGEPAQPEDPALGPAALHAAVGAGLRARPRTRPPGGTGDGHGTRFKAALSRYPRVDDASIFLAGVSHGFHAAKRTAAPSAPGLPGPGAATAPDDDFDDFGDVDDLGGYGGFHDGESVEQGRLFG